MAKRRAARTRTPAELDQALRELFAANDSWQLLDVVEQRYGWFDGACWDVAAALHEWLGRGELMLLCDRAEVPQHVVLRVGDLHLDADGVSSERQLLGRWQHRERVSGPRVEPFDASRATAAGLARSKPLRERLTAYLGERIDAANARITLDKQARHLQR